MSENHNRHLETPAAGQVRTRDRAALYRGNEPAFADWVLGAGLAAHDDLTQVRVHDMVDILERRGRRNPL